MEDSKRQSYENMEQSGKSPIRFLDSNNSLKRCLNGEFPYS